MAWFINNLKASTIVSCRIGFPVRSTEMASTWRFHNDVLYIPPCKERAVWQTTNIVLNLVTSHIVIVSHTVIDFLCISCSFIVAYDPFLLTFLDANAPFTEELAEAHHVSLNTKKGYYASINNEYI